MTFIGILLIGLVVGLLARWLTPGPTPRGILVTIVIGESMQKEHGVGAVEEAVLTRLEGGPYKDAVRFSNGREVLLQRLNCGLTVVVMTYGAELGEPSHSEPTVVRQHELV